MRPLERLAGQHLMILPVQYLSFNDSLGWRASVLRRADYLAGLDDEIGFALGERGLSRTWTFGAEVYRLSRANSTVMADARSLAAESLRGQLHPEDMLREPLASQIRGLAALRDGRYVLLPVELRFENVPTASSTGVAVLRLVLIDSRLAQIKWAGEVKSDPARAFSAALAASIAGHLADLVAAP